MLAIISNTSHSTSVYVSRHDVLDQSKMLRSLQMPEAQHLEQGLRGLVHAASIQEPQSRFDSRCSAVRSSLGLLATSLRVMPGVNDTRFAKGAPEARNA